MSSQGSLLPPILNPSSLYSQEAKRDATRIRIYNMVLQTIYNKVKAVARVPGNEKSLWYQVPEFIPGTPRFDIGDAVIYIVWNLRNAGYYVNYTPPTLLHISWKAHDTRYQEQESPWVQVLNSARQQVLTTALTSHPALVVSTGISVPATTGHSLSLQQQAHQAQQAEIQKRKTVLKKTNEYRPVTAILEEQTETPSQITGILSSKHVSFV